LNCRLGCHVATLLAFDEVGGHLHRFPPLLIAPLQSKVEETNKALPLAVPSPPTLRGRGCPGRGGREGAARRLVRVSRKKLPALSRRMEQRPLRGYAASGFARPAFGYPSTFGSSLAEAGHPCRPSVGGNSKRQRSVKKGFSSSFNCPSGQSHECCWGFWAIA
jgi:hypothetical protein